MIQFWSFEYNLVPLQSLNAVTGTKARRGSLLKIQWPDKKIGYADLMPWPEFGDEDLQTQLEGLKRGRVSTLLEQAIWLGRKDALLRSAGKNGLSEVPKVRNHLTITNIEAATSEILNNAKASGFNILKVKMGRDWTSELQWLTKTLREYPFLVRLDFNSQSDFSTLERMVTSLPPGLRQKLEYAEDPFEFDLESWKEASKILPLALDLEYDKVPWATIGHEVPFKTIVIKPARQDVDKALKMADAHQLKIVVSSSMDHPIGLLHAIRLAGEIRQKVGHRLLDCGCLTYKLFVDNEFTTQMIVQGPFLTKVPGTGVGFDNLLARLHWKPVFVRPS